MWLLLNLNVISRFYAIYMTARQGPQSAKADKKKIICYLTIFADLYSHCACLQAFYKNKYKGIKTNKGFIECLLLDR